MRTRFLTIEWHGTTLLSILIRIPIWINPYKTYWDQFNLVRSRTLTVIVLYFRIRNIWHASLWKNRIRFLKPVFDFGILEVPCGKKSKITSRIEIDDGKHPVPKDYPWLDSLWTPLSTKT